MAILNSKTGKTRKKYSVDDLKKAANLMRGYNMISLCAAGSGHSGGTLSIMDITAALYLHVADHDPKSPDWKKRDRIVWSAGHKAPSLYLGLGASGYYDIEEVAKLRKLYAPYQGHPHWCKLPGVEVSTGSRPTSTSRTTGSTASWATESSRKARSGKLSWRPATSSSTTCARSSTATACRSTGGSRT
jgi:transketolase